MNELIIIAEMLLVSQFFGLTTTTLEFPRLIKVLLAFERLSLRHPPLQLARSGENSSTPTPISIGKTDENVCGKIVVEICVYTEHEDRRDCAIRITNGIPSGLDAFGRHDSCTVAGRAALDRFDRREQGCGRRRRLIERARPTAIGITHVVKATRRRRRPAAGRVDGLTTSQSRPMVVASSRWRRRRRRSLVSSNRRAGLTNDFVRTRFRLSARWSGRERATSSSRLRSLQLIYDDCNSA